MMNINKEETVVYKKWWLRFAHAHKDEIKTTIYNFVMRHKDFHSRELALDIFQSEYEHRSLTLPCTGNLLKTNNYKTATRLFKRVYEISLCGNTLFKDKQYTVSEIGKIIYKFISLLRARELQERKLGLIYTLVRLEREYKLSSSEVNLLHKIIYHELDNRILTTQPLIWEDKPFLFRREEFRKREDFLESIFRMYQQETNFLEMSNIHTNFVQASKKAIRDKLHYSKFVANKENNDYQMENLVNALYDGFGIIREVDNTDNPRNTYVVYANNVTDRHELEQKLKGLCNTNLDLKPDMVYVIDEGIVTTYDLDAFLSTYKYNINCL